jgi:hypothetical protein
MTDPDFEFTAPARVVIDLPPGGVGVAHVVIEHDGERISPVNDDGSANLDALSALTLAYLSLARLLPGELRRDLTPLLHDLVQRDQARWRTAMH